MEKVVNFNHLMEKRILKRKCHALDYLECYYQPAGDGRATSGNNVYVQMRCRNCGRREDVFLSEKQYNTHRKILQKEIGNV
jgi:hypothetical protein|tara:strand:+ start:82 stop:324 length:243 start_codon:yes stop_codon:yes gene_type:complete